MYILYLTAVNCPDDSALVVLTPFCNCSSTHVARTGTL